MTTSIRQTDGELALDKTQNAIAGFEAGFAKFLRSELLLLDGKKFNEITFELLDMDLDLPDEFKLTLDTDGFPDGFSRIWSGTMFVSGTAKPTIAWRKG